MKTIDLKHKAGISKIRIQKEFPVISDFAEPEKTIIITDENVERYYSDKFMGFRKIVIPQKEKHKTLETLRNIYEGMLNYNIDRNCFILGVGGGIVCDVSGFAASTYMRGLEFGFLPTSLLAQVDASIGGKNGVNLKNFKNIIGSFNQPEFIVAPIEALSTLPENELRTGFAEIVKSALIGDREFYHYILGNYEKGLQLDGEKLEHLIYNAALIKAGIVELDETEQGIRAVLNFGHTLGHAIEKATDNYNHGEAVSIGMRFALKLSAEICGLDSKIMNEVVELLKKIGLPVSISINPAKLSDAFRKDKKKYGDEIRFILLEDIAKPIIKKISLAKLKEYITAFVA